MEQIIEKDKNNIQIITKMVKKLKIKEPSLKQFSMKLATEYLETDEEITNLIVNETACKKIEEKCINGLYKQHLTICSEKKMSAFYNEYNYENLIDKYENKIDECRNNSDNIIEVNSKKQLLHTEKSKIIDMLSRQFASSNFEKIDLIDIANFSKREIEKLYKRSKKILEAELTAVIPEEREILKDNHLGKLQFAITNYWYNKNNNEQKQEIQPKHKFKFWEWLKQLFKGKQPKLLEEGLEEKREKKVEALTEILINTFYETEFAGCFRSGSLEDKVHIMQLDEANIKENGNISERREMLKEQVLIKV